MATNGTRLLNSILGLEDEEENVNVGGGEQQGIYSNVPRVQAKHSGLHVGNLDNDYTNDEDDKDAGKGTVLADDGKYKSPYETKEGIKQVEEGTTIQEDPFKKRVGVVPDDIANHDSNKGMENDKADVAPAKTAEGTGNEQTYNDMYDVIKSLRESADEEEEQSKTNEAELKRTAKRRMLLAGIADAANSFHQAYAYARGIKPMNENKGYAKEVRKELREDLDWLRKNKDRVLNYRAKAAEIGRAIESLKNKEALMEWRTARLQADIDKTNDKSALEWKKVEIDEAYKNGLLTIKQYELLDRLVRTKIAQQNADTSSKNAETNAVKAGGYTKVKTDEFGNKTIEESTPNAGNSSAGGTSGNSNAGTSTSSNSNTGKKKLPTAKKPLPQS